MITQVLYSPKVVAALFDCTYETVRIMCREGRIPCVNLGTVKCPKWRVPLSFIEKAMRGEARWKYPRAIRRTCRTKVQSLDRIAKVTEEVNRIALMGDDEEDDENV